MGALHVVVGEAKGGSDVIGISGLVFASLAIFLTYLGKIKERTRRILAAVFAVVVLESVGLFFSIDLWVRVLVGIFALAIGVGIALYKSQGDNAVSKEHAEKLKQLLGAATRAVIGNTPYKPSGMDAEMLAAHFPKLDAELTAWNEAAENYSNSKAGLRKTVEARLRSLGADPPDYDFHALVNQLCKITEIRACERRRKDPLPPIEGFDDPVFTYFPEPRPHLKLSGNPDSVIQLPATTTTDPHDTLIERAKPIYELLGALQENEAGVLELRLNDLDKVRVPLVRDLTTQEKKTYYDHSESCTRC